MVKVFTRIVRVWIIFLSIAFLVAYVMGKYLVYKYLFILMGLTYGFTALEEAIVIGLDTGRGRFILLLSSIGFTAALAAAFNTHLWHLLFRISILLAVAFMFFHLQFRLKVGMGSMGFIITVIFALLSIFLSYLFSRYIRAGLFPQLILWIDVLSLILIIANFLVYLGGTIGKAWLAGAIAMSIFLAGDVFFLLGVPGHVELLLWFIPLFIMNNVALKVIEEEW